MAKVIAVVSGGLDSVIMAYSLKAQGHDLHILSFDYGQRHSKELAFARLCADRLQAGFSKVDLSSLGKLLGGSSLTDKSIAVPDGHYAEESMKITVVPNRNAIMLTIAYGVAVAEKAALVATAIHAGDHFIYPDCRPDFAKAFAAMQDKAIEGFGLVRLHTPFIASSKAEIVALGAGLGVPFWETWSCYKGGDFHCGTCGTCVERKEAFELAGQVDPTQYLS